MKGDDSAFLKTQLKQLIQNGTMWFFAAGAFAPKIEDTLDIIIEDFAIEYGDVYVNVVTMSNTDMAQEIWDFLHLPDYNANEIS